MIWRDQCRSCRFFRHNSSPFCRIRLHTSYVISVFSFQAAAKAQACSIVADLHGFAVVKASPKGKPADDAAIRDQRGKIIALLAQLGSVNYACLSNDIRSNGNRLICASLVKIIKLEKSSDALDMLQVQILAVDNAGYRDIAYFTADTAH